MTLNSKTIGVTAVFVFCLLCSIIAYQASGSRMAGNRSTAVAVVDLQDLMDGLNQRSDAMMRLERMRDEIEAEATRREEEAKALAAELKEIPEINTQARRAKEDQMMLGQLNNQAWLRLSADKLDIEKSISLQDIYRTIKKAIADLAAADGWDIVIVDDSPGELGYNPNSQLSKEAQVTQQVVSRRVLYARAEVNITDQLITRMNNAYQSGGLGGS